MEIFCRYKLDKKMINPGAALAAKRKTHTVPCVLCGAVFTGLIKKTMCTKCLTKLRAQKFKKKLKL